MNIKGILIVIILILGVLFFYNLNTFREGAEDMNAEKAQGLADGVQGDISARMAAADVPYKAPDTKDLFDQLKNLLNQEVAHQTARSNATAEVGKTISPAGITVAPTIINNSFFRGNKFSNPFCELYSGTSKLNDKALQASPIRMLIIIYININVMANVITINHPHPY